MPNTVEILVPDLGGAENVEVIEVLVTVGDVVSVGDELVVVESDKATMEIPAEAAGVLVQLSATMGAHLSEGDPIAVLELSGEADAQSSDRVTKSVMGGSVEGADSLSPGDKSVVPEELFLGTSPQGSEVDLEPASRDTPATDSDVSDSVGPVYASPSIRKLARELQVPLSGVTGTGRRGRITRDDVHDCVRSAMSGRTFGEASNPLEGLLPWPVLDFEKFGPVSRMELSRIRKINAANLHRNWVSIPHVTNHEDADITELEKFRQEVNADRAGESKVTLLAFLVKACVKSLMEFPEFNASLDGDSLIVKSYYNVGIAADTPNGLVVPVIKDADKKGVVEIAEEVRELALKAREGKLSPIDMAGGCFSISSLGGIGGNYFTPIINAPEVAILGVGKSTTQVAWVEGQAAPRLVLPLSLSWDHRVIDGAMAGRFNARVSSLLADFRRVVL